uniref:Uncharacterized protein n=1 Tax=Cucumis sativus TaxID=3659 RepID=A0A0A0KDM3_CUCSA
MSLDPEFPNLTVNPATKLGSICVFILTFFAPLNFCTCFAICAKCCCSNCTTELTTASSVFVILLYTNSNSVTISFRMSILFASTKIFKKFAECGCRDDEEAISSTTACFFSTLIVGFAKKSNTR